MSPRLTDAVAAASPRAVLVDPAACLVLEDADEGLEAARRAGIPAIDVRTVSTGPAG